MLKNKKNLIIASGCILALLISCVSFAVHLRAEKHTYRLHLTLQIKQYLEQQQALLQRLGKNLVTPIKQGNIQYIAQSLTAYEEILFTLAKQGLATPVSVYLVSLDGPQQIVGSFGLLDNSVLAPDEIYYARTVEDPATLAVSKLYVKHEMPDYQMLNLGLGIAQSENYYGQLDVKIAVTGLYDFIASKLSVNSELFYFKFMDNNLLQPKIYFIKSAVIVAGIKYILWRLSIIFISAIISLTGYRLFKKFRRQQQELLQAKQKLRLVTNKLDCTQLAIEVQNNYALLLAGATHNTQLIDIQQLLDEVKAVNLVLAMERSVALIFPEYNATVLRFHGHQVRLMQILSGILREVILQLSVASKVELQVVLCEDQSGKQKIDFIFTDNGFYDKLQDTVARPLLTDIRCQSWRHICELVEVEGATLEHKHIAYVGNTIRFSIMRKVVNNVVSFEAY